ncbi:unnamed protein product, partial [Lampetra planeri]
MDRVDGLRETRSQYSVSSSSTTRLKAHIATAAAWKKAEQESILATAAAREQESKLVATAARKKAELEEQESILVATATRKKIELDAKLSTLQLKREAAAARAQAEVLEAAANLDKEENWSEFGTQIPVKDRDQLTRKHILDWSEQCINAPPPNNTEQRVDVQASPSPHRMNMNADYGNGGNAYPALRVSRRLSVAHVGSD